MMFEQMLPIYVEIFDRSYDQSSKWIETYSICLITPLHLIAFHIHSLEQDQKQAFTWIAIKLLEIGLIESVWRP